MFGKSAAQLLLVLGALVEKATPFASSGGRDLPRIKTFNEGFESSTCPCGNAAFEDGNCRLAGFDSLAINSGGPYNTEAELAAGMDDVIRVTNNCWETCYKNASFMNDNSQAEWFSGCASTATDWRRLACAPPFDLGSQPDSVFGESSRPPGLGGEFNKSLCSAIGQNFDICEEVVPPLGGTAIPSNAARKGCNGWMKKLLKWVDTKGPWPQQGSNSDGNCTCTTSAECKASETCKADACDSIYIFYPDNGLNKAGFCQYDFDNRVCTGGGNGVVDNCVIGPQEVRK